MSYSSQETSIVNPSKKARRLDTRGQRTWSSCFLTRSWHKWLFLANSVSKCGAATTEDTFTIFIPRRKGVIDSTSEAYETFVKNQLVIAGVDAHVTSLRGRPMWRGSHILRTRKSQKRSIQGPRRGWAWGSLAPHFFGWLNHNFFSSKSSKQCSRREILFFCWKRGYARWWHKQDLAIWQYLIPTNRKQTNFVL